MKSIFAQHGVLASINLIATTATPTIGFLSCLITSGDAYVEFSVTNNDASTATIEVSLFSDFSNSSTLSVNSSSSGFFSLIANNNPPGSTTVYARAIVSGKNTSTTTTRTQNLVLCAFE
jgi:hypothetical protein